MNSYSCPTLLISAPASGQGKTTITAGLAHFLTKRGKRVRVFKCGPDFLDPFWLSLACQNPVYQIDLWMTGEDDCQNRLRAAAEHADVILIEGAMGLFDGDPSAADLAIRFNIPVMAVIDASAMAGTFGALALGLEQYRPHMKWAGVLANRVASPGHATMLESAIANPQHFLGAIFANAEMGFPERHLGLIMSSEIVNAVQKLDLIADAIETSNFGETILQRLPSFAVEYPTKTKKTLSQKLLDHKIIAVAKDAAFCFIYQANLDVLEKLGARIQFFSPLRGGPLPICDAVWLPGGYPELYAEALGNHQELKNQLHIHIQNQRPIWAECGGMMALFETLITADGQSFPMWGALPGTITMQKRLGGLGLQALHLHDQEIRGHTFHYSTCTSPLKAYTQCLKKTETANNASGELLFQKNSLQASYFHAWFASNPLATASLFLPQDCQQ
jgi:cobyrinic acid a,c-diamide synthase